MNRRFTTALELFVLVLTTAFSLPLHTDSTALELLKTHISNLQQILRDPKFADDEHLIQRRKSERAILQQLFDFQEIAQRSLGANARKYNDRLGEFTPLFIDFLEHAYMGTLEENGDAKIQYLREIVVDDSVEINTKTSLKNGREYWVDYRFFLSPAGWSASDVIVEGISLVGNYRSQFDRVLRKKSFDELLQDLREKKDKLN